MPTPDQSQPTPSEIIPDTIADDKLYPRQSDILKSCKKDSSNLSSLGRRARIVNNALVGDGDDDNDNDNEHDNDHDSTNHPSSSSLSRQKRRITNSNHISSITNIDAYQNHFFTKHDTATCTSSFLRPGSTFAGTQQSGRSTYEVNVEIKRVDMENAFICGYLRIEGLTEDHPTLITYFEGEMISDKHSFYTKREDWGANDKTDVAHWSRFPPWRIIAKQAKDHKYVHENYTQKQHIYMRWKECFLVPDHRVIDIQGASYAGFYYICFDQSNGSFTGFYFHQISDKYQQLDLSYCQNSGQYPKYEFR